ncbi:MAG: hypothetical protein MW690_000534 [Methanophagales archaeon]|nr:hypothetical protein [Methanophagales archaeon]
MSEGEVPAKLPEGEKSGSTVVSLIGRMRRCMCFLTACTTEQVYLRG